MNKESSLIPWLIRHIMILKYLELGEGHFHAQQKIQLQAFGTHSGLAMVVGEGSPLSIASLADFKILQYQDMAHKERIITDSLVYPSCHDPEIP